MQLNMIDHRIEMLDTAERLAMQDTNPKNRKENMDIIFRCIAGKIELWNIKSCLLMAGRTS